MTPRIIVRLLRLTGCVRPGCPAWSVCDSTAAGAGIGSGAWVTAADAVRSGGRSVPAAGCLSLVLMRNTISVTTTRGHDPPGYHPRLTPAAHAESAVPSSPDRQGRHSA